MIELIVHKKHYLSSYYLFPQKKFILFMEKNKNICGKYEINYSYFFIYSYVFKNNFILFFFIFT